MRFFLVAVAAFVVLAGCQVEDEVNTEAECVTDADCDVAGCSGQLCATAEEAPGIITTCEYREQYDCLQLTSCGCIEGKCAWAQTEEYASCLEDYQKK